ncbi:MAG: hypothetical protein IKZ25_02175 [Clostridia bacterium]|nr:hypothetical protein [Clostridia bacterium]
MKKIIPFILLLIIIINSSLVSAANVADRDFEDSLVIASRIPEDYKIPSPFDNKNKDAIAPILSNLISSFKENEEAYMVFNQVNLYGNLTDALAFEDFSQYMATTEDKTNNFFCLTYIDNETPKTYAITEKNGKFSIAEEYDADYTEMAYYNYYLYPHGLSAIMAEHRLTNPEKATFINIPYLGVHGLYIVCDNIEYIFVMDILNEYVNEIFNLRRLYIVEDFIKKVSPLYYGYDQITSEQKLPSNNAFLNTEVSLENISAEFGNATMEDSDRYFKNYQLTEFEKHFFSNSSEAKNPEYSSTPSAPTDEKTTEKNESPKNSTLVGNIMLICVFLIILGFGVYKLYGAKIMSIFKK